MIGGIGSAAFANMQTSLIVLHAPPHIRSRLMGLLTVCIGMGPLGILLIGALADRFGPLLAVDIMALTGLVAVSAIGLVWRRNDLRAAGRRAGTRTGHQGLNAAYLGTHRALCQPDRQDRQAINATCGRTTAMPDVSVELQFLSGIRVVDFTQFEAGPSCTEALAWLGAEVVKIENPKTGDPGRRLRAGQPDDDPYYFQMFNANKKSITVNLKSPRGLELVKDLLRKADVCVENMAPGTIERLGLGYDVVRELNPGIIYCQVKGFGTGSPYEKNLAFDMIAQATGGTISVTGEKGRMPVKPGLSLGDTGTGMTMAITILGALYPSRRDRRGPSAAGGDAGRDAALHAHQLLHAGAQRQGGGARRHALGRRQQRAVGTVSVRAGRRERLRLDHDQPGQSRALGAAVQGDGTRGTDQRSALRHAARAREERCRAGRDHHRMDTHAHQARGDGSRSAAPAFPPVRCSTRWNCRTSRPSRSAASCR